MTADHICQRGLSIKDFAAKKPEISRKLFFIFRVCQPISQANLFLMITLRINSQEITVAQGSTVATAILAGEAEIFRRSISGEPRFPLCGMGACFECRITINGVKHQRSCQILAEEGMMIETDR